MRTVASIDIGTDKIVALIGEVDSYGDVHIVGIGESKSRGIDRGSVTRLEVAARAISTAVREAEEMSGQKVGGVVINVSGPPRVRRTVTRSSTRFRGGSFSTIRKA